MVRFIRSAIAVAGLAFAAIGASTSGAQATSIVEIGAPKKENLLSLGVAPEKKEIVLKLGALRTGEAKLPPGELTLAQRNRLRIRAAVEIQNAVSNARRDRVNQRNEPEQRPEVPSYDEDDRPEFEEDEVVVETEEGESSGDDGIVAVDDASPEDDENDVVADAGLNIPAPTSGAQVSVGKDFLPTKVPSREPEDYVKPVFE